MAWLFRDKTDPEWKQNWLSRTMSSISLPPPPLLALFAITVLLFSVSKHMEYREEIHKTENNFNILLFLLPVILLLIVRSMCVNGRFVFSLPIPEPDSIHQIGSSPWGVAALVVFLLIMVSCQSSFQSRWFRPL